MTPAHDRVLVATDVQDLVAHLARSKTLRVAAVTTAMVGLTAGCGGGSHAPTSGASPALQVGGAGAPSPSSLTPSSSATSGVDPVQLVVAAPERITVARLSAMRSAWFTAEDVPTASTTHR